MAEVLQALVRTLGSLAQPRIWLYMLLPVLLAALLGLGLAAWVLEGLMQEMLAYPPMTLLVSWGLVWLAHVIAWLGGWMALLALAYLLAALFAALVTVPLMLRYLSRREYRNVAALGQESLARATVNSLGAAILFILGWGLTLPLWLIPGGALVLPVLLMAAFNRRTFAYDALAQHATDTEWRTLRREQRGALFLLGLVWALFAHVPLLGLLAPPLAALSFIHFGLAALYRQRGGAVVSVAAERLPD